MTGTASRLWERLTRPERDQGADVERQKREARSFIDWTELPYYDLFTAWLTKEAHKPIRTDSFMGVDVMRSNTFKEILAHLEAKERMARSVLDE